MKISFDIYSGSKLLFTHSVEVPDLDLIEMESLDESMEVVNEYVQSEMESLQYNIPFVNRGDVARLRENERLRGNNKYK